MLDVGLSCSRMKIKKIKLKEGKNWALLQKVSKTRQEKRILLLLKWQFQEENVMMSLHIQTFMWTTGL